MIRVHACNRHLYPFDQRYRFSFLKSKSRTASPLPRKSKFKNSSQMMNEKDFKIEIILTFINYFCKENRKSLNLKMGKKLFFLPKFRKLCGKYIGKSLDLDLVNVDVVMDDKTDAAMDDEMDVELAASSGVPAVNVTCLDDLVGFVENEWDLVDLNIEFNWTWIGFALQETRDDFISRVLVQSCKLFISSPLPIKSSTAILEALQITNPSSLQLTRSPDSPVRRALTILELQISNYQTLMKNTNSKTNDRKCDIMFQCVKDARQLNLTPILSNKCRVHGLQK